MANVGRTVEIRGEIQTGDDLTIDGYVEGLVCSDGLAVTVAEGAEVNGDIVARDITVLGQVTGSLIARGVVDVRVTATVSGRIVAASFVLAEGASFSGLVQPQQIDNTERSETAPAATPLHVTDPSALPVSNQVAAVSVA